MGDYTSLSLTIGKVGNKAAATACREVIREYDLRTEWSGDLWADTLGDNEGIESLDLRLGEPWVDDEARVGTAWNIANALQEHKVWFGVQEDPKYEWLGVLVMFTPSLGRYEQACGSGGTPLFTDSEVRDMLDLVWTKRLDTNGANRMLGKPWFDELAVLMKDE